MTRVYLVEDEYDLANLVVKYLLKDGYEVERFSSGEEALNHINDKVDLWILDIMLPGSVNGYDLIKAIKKNNPLMPVIFTSARDQDIDRVLGLELGGDDYLSKPYSLRELMLRVKNILLRVTPKVVSSVEKIGPYEVNLGDRSVKYRDSLIELTSKEYDLLCFLLEKKSQKFSRDEILFAIWGNEYNGSNRVVDDLMRRLRNKLPHLRVETLYGYGYRLL
jgi:two-component system response regulator CssR